MTRFNKTLRRPQDLIDSGLAPAAAAEDLARVTQRYALAISPAMARLIDPKDPNDPIARQFIPDPRELEQRLEEQADPIGDERHSPVKGIVHRYADRVLLKIVAVCPVYCRFCFRREMVGPGAEQMLPAGDLDQALDYIAQHQEIWEVIVTGGDPFTLSPRRIGQLTQRLSAISHVKIIRWHSRVPVVDPQRITNDFVQSLQCTGCTAQIVIHANHPGELTPEACRSIAMLADAGLPLYAQSVLLKGVNDDADVLAALMRRFVELRIKPYYLHHGDLAPGTGHLRTTIAAGQALMRDLRQKVSGICLPEYVLDIPGGHGKVPIGPTYCQDAAGAAGPKQTTDGKILDPSGQLHAYPPDNKSTATSS